jgi:FtsP/CotA-like multicopper oxidase with cupredoxin domain
MRHTATLITASLLVLAGCGAPGDGAGVTVRDREAVNQLPIPPVVEGEEITLTADEGETDFGQDGLAPTIGLNGSYLGPTMRLTRGQEVNVDVVNNLDEMTTLHWHGMKVPAKMDGGPHSMIQSGQTWAPTWTVDQPAATLWYHSHPHGETAQQVYRGLAGMILIDDPQAPDVGLPDTYGVDDIPLVVQDKSFTSDGQLVIDPADGPSTGFLGDTIVTNGKLGTFLPVTTEAVRLRLLNASNARFYNFGFSDNRDFAIVGSDGGLLAAPVTSDRVLLGPGERAEVVVRVTPGETVSLNSTPPDLGSTNDALFSSGTFDVVELRAAPSLTAAPEVAERLAEVPAPDAAASAQTRTFAVQGRAINGRPMDMNRIDMAVPVDQTEVWEITNVDPQPHNFHVHNVQFRILSMNGQPPPPELSGYKDTVYVAPRTTVKILVKFTDYTNPDWPYMFHCHLLLHEDLGVMGQFVVVKPGEKAGRPPTHDHMAMG